MNVLLVLILAIAMFAVAFHFAPQGWRTVLFNALAAIPVVGVPLTDALSGFDWSAMFDKAEAAMFALAVTVGNVVLRSLTTTPIGKSDSGEQKD
jgi:hypothetical protein